MRMAPSPGFWQEASPSPTGPVQRLLEPLQTWQVTSPRVRDPRENSDSQCCLCLTLKSHIPALPPYSTCRKQITQSQKGTWVLPFERDKYQRIRERILKPWRQRWLFSACRVEGRFLYVPASFTRRHASPSTLLPDRTSLCCVWESLAAVGSGKRLGCQSQSCVPGKPLSKCFFMNLSRVAVT